MLFSATESLWVSSSMWSRYSSWESTATPSIGLQESCITNNTKPDFQWTQVACTNQTTCYIAYAVLLLRSRHIHACMSFTTSNILIPHLYNVQHNVPTTILHTLSYFLNKCNKYGAVFIILYFYKATEDIILQRSSTISAKLSQCQSGTIVLTTKSQHLYYSLKIGLRRHWRQIVFLDLMALYDTIWTHWSYWQISQLPSFLVCLNNPASVNYYFLLL